MTVHLNRCIILIILFIFGRVAVSQDSDQIDVLFTGADSRLLDERVSMESTCTGDFDLSKYQALAITCSGAGQDIRIEIQKKWRANTYWPFYTSAHYRVPDNGRIVFRTRDLKSATKSWRHLQSIERIAVVQTRVSVIPGHTPVKILRVEGIKSLSNQPTLTPPASTPKPGTIPSWLFFVIVLLLFLIFTFRRRDEI